MTIDMSDLNAGPCEAAAILEQAAEEFVRRAMTPLIAPGFERARVLACSQWLRDMAYELRGGE